jgi:hypothetical protein
VKSAVERPAEAFERACGQYTFRSAADADHEVDVGVQVRGHDRPGDVAVEQKFDARARVAYSAHEVGLVPAQDAHCQLLHRHAAHRGDVGQGGFDRCSGIDHVGQLGCAGDLFHVDARRRYCWASR